MATYTKQGSSNLGVSHSTVYGHESGGAVAVFTASGSETHGKIKSGAGVAVSQRYATGADVSTHTETGAGFVVRAASGSEIKQASGSTRTKSGVAQMGVPQTAPGIQKTGAGILVRAASGGETHQAGGGNTWTKQGVAQMGVPQTAPGITKSGAAIRGTLGSGTEQYTPAPHVYVKANSGDLGPEPASLEPDWPPTIVHGASGGETKQAGGSTRTKSGVARMGVPQTAPGITKSGAAVLVHVGSASEAKTTGAHVYVKANSGDLGPEPPSLEPDPSPHITLAGSGAKVRIGPHLKAGAAILPRSAFGTRTGGTPAIPVPDVSGAIVATVQTISITVVDSPETVTVVEDDQLVLA